MDVDSYNLKVLKEKYSRVELEDFLVDLIYNGDIKFPYKELTPYDAVKSFNSLVDYKTQGLIKGNISTKFDYKYPISDYYVDAPIIGNTASDYFQYKNRMECGHVHFPSPIEVWQDKKQIKHLVGGIFTLKYEYINSSALRTLIAMRAYIASQFRPAIAKTIYEMYGAKNVIDFSAGWGDRLCGFYASNCTESYIGIDPNKKVYDNYYKQADLYKSLTKEKEVTFINSPAEEVDYLKEESADLVFTSPPYFKTEKYCDEDTQSFSRYSKVDDWLNGFMFKTIDNVWKTLKVGGRLAINISDVKEHGKLHKICDRMNEYIESEKEGKYDMCFGMKLSQRPNCDASLIDEDSILVEPVWVFEKIK